jgi:hypothetical protein
MEEWDPAVNDFVLRCNSCWRTNNHVKKIIRTSRKRKQEKSYEQVLVLYNYRIVDVKQDRKRKTRY